MTGEEQRHGFESSLCLTSGRKLHLLKTPFPCVKSNDNNLSLNFLRLLRNTMAVFSARNLSGTFVTMPNFQGLRSWKSLPVTCWAQFTSEVPLLLHDWLLLDLPEAPRTISMEGKFSQSCYLYLPAKHLEKTMATHSSTLAWEIPWTEEPGRLQSMGLQRVGHDWVTSLSLFTFMRWRRKWQATPVFMPGESQRWEPGGLPSMGSQCRTQLTWLSSSSSSQALICSRRCSKHLTNSNWFNPVSLKPPLEIQLVALFYLIFFVQLPVLK